MTATLPTWRQHAPAGLSLAQAQGALPAVRSAAAVPLPLPSDLRRILRPEAAGNWLLPSTAILTPQYIDLILRGALNGSPQQSWELFDLMEDTWPRLVKDLNELKRAVVQMDWKLEPWAEEDAPPTPEAEARARLVSNAVWRMQPDPAADENNFAQTIYDVLDAWAKGVSVLEILWQNRTDRALGDVLAPQATTWVHPQHYGWSDGRLGLRSVPSSLSTLPSAGFEEFPPDKFLVAVCKSRSAHASVAALLRPLAFTWCGANFTAEWLLNHAQLFGQPVRWANYDPAVPGLVDTVSDMLENMGSSAWAAFPAGTTLELKEAGKTGADNPQVTLLQRADTICDILILGQTLTTDVGASGSLALGAVHKTVRDEIVAAAAEFAANVINYQLVPAILRLNYGDAEDAPEFRPAPQTVEDEKANAERDNILLTAGIDLPKTWFYERHKIPLPQPGEDTITGRAPAAPDFGFSQNRPASPTGPKSPAEPEPEPEAELAARAARAPQNPEAVIEDIVAQSIADGLHARRQWLAPLSAEIKRIIALAENEQLTDADALHVIEAAQRRLPELAMELDRDAFAKHLTAVAGTAVRVALEQQLA